MADSILKIRTQDGDKPIGYPGLADKPVANKTLDTEGAFADAKVVGDKFKEVKAETASLKEDMDDEINRNDMNNYNIYSYTSTEIKRNVGDIDSAVVGTEITFGSTDWYEFFKIPVREYQKLAYEIRATRSKHHIVFTDENNVVLKAVCKGTGTAQKVIDTSIAPRGSAYAYIATHASSNINSGEYSIVKTFESTTENIKKNETLIKVSGVSPATAGLFEKKIFDADLGYSPQGLVVIGKKAYTTKGYDNDGSGLNIVTEINLDDGTFLHHSIVGMTGGGNCATIDVHNNILFVTSHEEKGNIYEIDMKTWRLIGKYICDIKKTDIAYDSFERCFYMHGITDGKIYKLNRHYEVIDHIDLNLENVPTEKLGTGQGLGYDGNYFYIPISDVYYTSENSCVFVYDKNGKFVKSFRGCHAEIEDISFDSTTGNYYCTYAHGATGYITQFVQDSGWLNMVDYLSNDYDSYALPSNIDIEKSTASIRIKNNMVIFKGYLKINSLASNMTNVLTYLEERLSPCQGFVATLYVTSSDEFSNPDIIRSNMSYVNPYVVPEYLYTYAPISGGKTGYIWLDGIVAPLGRDSI